MPIHMYENGDNVLVARVCGHLHKTDYDALFPVVERLIAHQGPLRVLLDLTDLDEWDEGALWPTSRLHDTACRHVERMALVGETAREPDARRFCQPFSEAEVRYYSPQEAGSAQDWLRE